MNDPNLLFVEKTLTSVGQYVYIEQITINHERGDFSWIIVQI